MRNFNDGFGALEHRHIASRANAASQPTMRMGDRLYVSYWHHGYHILDISDMSKPKLIASGNTSPVFPHPTHTCLPIPQPLKGRKVMVVADEDVAKLWPAAPAFAWIYDITNEQFPVPIATFQVAGLDPDGAPQAPMMGCHQPSERFAGTIIPFAWFAKGLRILDIADPFAPREVVADAWKRSASLRFRRSLRLYLAHCRRLRR